MTHLENAFLDGFDARPPVRQPPGGSAGKQSWVEDGVIPENRRGLLRLGWQLVHVRKVPGRAGTLDPVGDLPLRENRRIQYIHALCFAAAGGEYDRMADKSNKERLGPTSPGPGL